jgi:hypothetical protein
MMAKIFLFVMFMMALGVCMVIAWVFLVYVMQWINK